MASYEYSSKQDLLETIHTLYLLLDAEYGGIDDKYKDTRIPEVDKTPPRSSPISWDGWSW